MGQIREAGADLVAISPQRAEYNAKVTRRHHLEFEVLSDRGNAASRQWGLVHTVEGALRETYLKGLSLDLPRINGEDSWTLPIPGRFVVGPGARILAADWNPDYTRRPEPQATIDFLQTMSPRESA